MKNSILLICYVLSVLTSCRDSEITKAQIENKLATGNNAEITESRRSITMEEVWVPEYIEECLPRVKSPEPIEIESSFNPYYLRVNMDGLDGFETVVLVRGVSDKKKRGVLICQNSKEPYLFGTIAKSAVPFSDMRDDNFVTNRWEALSHVETKAFTRHDNGKLIGSEAKGESVIFVFEGGAFVIYWDGKQFKGVGGA